MTPSMTAIQHSVLEIMKACVRELKETNPLVGERGERLIKGIAEKIGKVLHCVY